MLEQLQPDGLGSSFEGVWVCFDFIIGFVFFGFVFFGFVIGSGGRSSSGIIIGVSFWIFIYKLLY